MTALTLTMPRLGETMEDGLIVGWMVQPGQPFKRGEPILELETDKTVVEFPALGDGMLDETLAGPGDRITVGHPIARATVAQAADWSDAAAPEAEPAPVAAPEPAPVRATHQPSGGLRATPPARLLARQSGVDLASVTGSGRRGRIELRDVQAGDAPSGDLRWLDSPAGRIAYAVAGQGGRTHLLVHGFAGDRSAWAQISAALARAGQTAVALDLPGHGDTQAEAAHPDALADAVVALARTLPAGLVLIGHSLGAAAAVAAADRLGAHVARLILLTPAGCGPRIGADFVHGMANADSPGEIAHLLRLLGPKGGTLSDAALSGMARQMGRGRLRALADRLATPDGRQRIDILRPLATLTVPTAAIFGTDDRIVDPRDALNLPLSVAAHFVAAGHMPQWDAARELTAFITGDRHG